MIKAVTQVEFAAIIKRSKGYVTQLKQSGRLVLDDDGKVLVTASKKRIAETADANRDDVAKRHSEARKNKTKAPTEKISAKETKAKVTFSESRAKAEYYRALDAEADYKKKIGELVSKEEMAAAVEDVITTFRQALENMPYRLAPEFIGKDLDFIRSTMKHEIFDVLQDLSTNFAKKFDAQEDN